MSLLILLSALLLVESFEEYRGTKFALVISLQKYKNIMPFVSEIKSMIMSNYFGMLEAT